MVHGNDMPQGLAFGMGMNQQAMENFAKMSEEEKRQVLEAARKYAFEGTDAVYYRGPYPP